MDLRMPIPMFQDMPTPGVQVQECGEPLIDLAATWRIRIAPQYPGLGFRHAPQGIRIRHSVARAIAAAAHRLPDKCCLLLWDGVRSIELQREIRERTIRDLSSLGRAADLDMYVASVPMTEADFLAAPPPHCTGGAIDLTLADEFGKALDLGAGFDEFNRTAWLRHFESTSQQAVDRDGQPGPRELRRILYNAMTSVGFVGYEFEFWHYELGTLRAASRLGLKRARFGPATPWTTEEN
jgi:D-alanyl-D-alanine dipeptidase